MLSRSEQYVQMSPPMGIEGGGGRGGRKEQQCNYLTYACALFTVTKKC